MRSVASSELSVTSGSILTGDPLPDTLSVAEPSRKCCFRFAGFDVGYAMLKVPGNDEEDGVTQSGVLNLRHGPTRLPLPHLENTAPVSARAQVEAHSDQPAVGEVVMPVVGMADIGRHPVYPAFEPA